MTWFRLALANLLLSPLTSAVNILLMTLGTASVVLLILAGERLSDTLTRDARGLDLVVGAKGSPAQLILSSVYHADLPTGNILLADARPWAEDPRVEVAAPLALGDSFRGFRIAGTTPAYLSLFDASLAEGELWQRPLEAVLGAAVAGTSGLRVGDYFSGAHGFADGGHEHESQPYKVVGILAPTGAVIDRLIVTDLQSVWTLHGDGEHDHEEDGHEDDADHDHEDEEHEDDADHDHEDEEHEDDADHDHGEEEHEADGHEEDAEHDHEGEGHEDDSDHEDEEHEDDADHDHEDEEHGDEADHDDDGEHDHEDEEHEEHEDDHDAHGNDDNDREITALLLRYRTPLAAMTLPREINAIGELQAAAPAVEISRILQLVGLGLDGLRTFAWVLIVTACLSVFAALYGSLRSRRGDLAMLRCLGATRAELFLAMLSEGMILSIAGIVLGYGLGHGAVSIASVWLETSRGVSLAGLNWAPAETALLGVLLTVSVISAAIPALQAYRTDVARTLAEGGG